jgi:hypothetical protein
MIAVRRRAVEVGGLQRARDRHVVPQMAFRNDFGAAIDLGSVVDRPERADAEGRARPRQPDAAVVEMPRLRGLAGLQIDRQQRRQQAARSEFRFGKGQCQGMDREFRKQWRLRQQGIDPVGLQALEIVAAGEITRQMRRQRGANFGDTIGGEHPFEDQVAAAVEFLPPRCEGPPLQP